MSDLETIVRDALRLQASERAALAQALLASLDEVDETDAEALWGIEAQRRLEALRAGRARTTPAVEVASKAEKLFR